MGKSIIGMLVIMGFLVLPCACSDDDDSDAGIDGGATDTDTDTDIDTDTDTDTDADAGALAIIGSYTESWGAAHEITASSWTTVFPPYEDAGPTTSKCHIETYDNAAGYLTAQNDSVDSYYPNLWSRYDWVYDSQADGGVSLYYCQPEYAAADEATAAANTSADHGDLSGGCNGFSWGQLIAD